MPETIVHTGEGVVDGTVTGLAGALGSVTNEVAHQAETVAAHAEKLTKVDEDTQWIKDRLSSLEQATTDGPAAAISEVRQQVADLRNEVMAQMAALSEEIASGPSTPEEPQTEPPPPAHNAAVPKEPSGVRKLLHRLL